MFLQTNTIGQIVEIGGAPVEIDTPAGLPATVAADVTWTLTHPTANCYYVISASGTLSLDSDCALYSGTISGTLTRYNSSGSQCSSSSFSQTCTIKYRYCHTGYGVSLTGCAWAFIDWGLPYISGSDPIGTYAQGATHAIGPETICDCSSSLLDVAVTMVVS